MRITRKRNLPSLVLAVCLGFWAAAMVWFATAWGPWAFSDGVGYLVSARNLMHGRGLGLFHPSGTFIPAISHPPLYPILLAAVGALPGDTLVAARVIDILAFPLLVVASGLVFHHLSGSRSLSLALSLVLLVNPALLIAYTSAMAEPLFLLTGMVGLLLLVSHLQFGGRGTFCAAVVCVSLSFLTRYAGVAFIGAGALSLLVLARSAARRRVSAALVFLTLSAAPVACFFAWAKLITHARDFRVLTPSLDAGANPARFVSDLAGVIWSWKPLSATTLSLLRGFADHRQPAVALILLAVGLALVGLVLLTLRDQPDAVAQPASSPALRSLLTTFLLFEACYLATLLASYLGTTPTPDIDTRTTLPLLLGAFYSVFAALGLLAIRMRPGSLWKIAGLALISLFVLGYAVDSADIVQGLHRTGLGYTAPRWQRSETIHAVRNLPADLSLISNEPMPILLYADRWPHPVAELEQNSPSQFLRYGLGTTEAEHLFEGGRTALVLFDSAAEEFERLYPGRGKERMAALVDGLRLRFQGEDGAIYLAPSP